MKAGRSIMMGMGWGWRSSCWAKRLLMRCTRSSLPLPAPTAGRNTTSFSPTFFSVKNCTFRARVVPLFSGEWNARCSFRF